jgi:hypothetical protein
MNTDTHDHAARFRAIADKIDLNGSADFGGAYVIVGPEGTSIDLLMLDGKANPAVFWSTVQTRVQIVLAEIADAERSGGMGQGFRR